MSARVQVVGLTIGVAGIAGVVGVGTRVSGAVAAPRFAANPGVRLAAGLHLEVITTDVATPRAVVVLDGSTALVTSFSWDPRRAELYRLTRSGTTWSAARVQGGIDRPGSMIVGPDGKVYLGEVGRVSRFAAGTPAKRETVVSGLPGKGRHPLATFTFRTPNELVVNVGSSTDNCEASKGKAVCPEAEANNGLGLLRAYDLTGSGPATKWTVLARGMRNSVALVTHSSGTLLEADNGRDAINKADRTLSDAALPHDELNEIVPGQNYGWPYCYDNQRNSPEFRRYACSDTTSPQTLLPPHSAPLGMAYWNGRLVVAYHGYRELGHRLVAFPVNARGVPSGPSTDLVSGWEENDSRSAGGPVGLMVAPDNSLWVTDDRNDQVLRLTAP